ncbi:hypothetical protein M378DRAFT_543905 [Amanita muscaria Koide BX008]|uniref:Secreted protein n=1 Tax=Amanita muscaria (strain Koide BX008) TaxID=946122 RepID=A0A0C2X8Q0_AMAMK|nr:hypothetical protein M378DRAFT_543905 [Amanita muscaria Koide BX008]
MRSAIIQDLQGAMLLVLVALLTTIRTTQVTQPIMEVSHFNSTDLSYIYFQHSRREHRGNQFYFFSGW